MLIINYVFYDMFTAPLEEKGGCKADFDQKYMPLFNKSCRMTSHGPLGGLVSPHLRPDSCTYKSVDQPTRLLVPLFSAAFLNSRYLPQ